MAPVQNSGKNKKNLKPIILSAAFVLAGGALIYMSEQLKNETEELRDSREKLEENITQIKESLKETQKDHDKIDIETEEMDSEIIALGRKVLDIHCSEAFEAAIVNEQIPTPVTEKALLEAGISIDVPYNDEMPLSKMTKWVESHGPEYQVTNGKLDCSYLIKRKPPAP